MSHLTKVKTTLNNKEHLIKALRKMGFNVEVAENGKKLKTKGNYKQVTDVDILIKGHGSKDYNNAIGFAKEEDGTFTAVGDFYQLKKDNGKTVSMDSIKGEATAFSKISEMEERLNNLNFVEEAGSFSEDSEYVEVSYERWA